MDRWGANFWQSCRRYLTFPQRAQWWKLPWFSVQIGKCYNLLHCPHPGKFWILAAKSVTFCLGRAAFPEQGRCCSPHISTAFLRYDSHIRMPVSIPFKMLSAVVIWLENKLTSSKTLNCSREVWKCISNKVEDIPHRSWKSTDLHWGRRAFQVR